MMDDADYLAAWRVIVAPILDQFKPTFVIVSAGFDAAYGHSQALGGYDFFIRLNSALFLLQSERLFGFCEIPFRFFFVDSFGFFLQV